MISRRTRTAILAAQTVGALSFGSTPPAQAQSSNADRDYAQGLYDEAMIDLNAKRFEIACAKLEQASTLVPEGVGVKLMLAECLEGWGKPGRAYAMYDQAERGADAAGQAERKKKAADHMRALEPRIARLTLSVARTVAEAAGLRITINGVGIAPESFGSPIVVDPGTITIRASAEGGSFERTLEVSAGSTAPLTIDSLDAPPATTASHSSGPARDAPASNEAHANVRARGESQGMSGVRIGGFIVGGIGVVLGGVGVGLGTAGVLGANQAAEDFTAADGAGNAIALERARNDHASNADQATAGWVLTGVGGAALVTGIVLVVVGGSGAEPTGTTALRMSPWVAGAGDALPRGVELSGRW